jgi:hypothetical protein
MTAFIAPVVEGHTELSCIGPLLQRVWRELLPRTERLQVLEPTRGHRADLVKPDGQVLTEKVSQAFLKLRSATRKVADARPLALILLDAEDDCPASLGPQLLGTAKKTLPEGSSIACVIAKRMLENWIIAGGPPWPA